MRGAVGRGGGAARSPERRLHLSRRRRRVAGRRPAVPRSPQHQDARRPSASSSRGDAEYVRPAADRRRHEVARRAASRRPSRRTSSRATATDASAPITTFADPARGFAASKKQLVTYKRTDGVTLSFTLYLPPGYKQGEKRAALLWAYPREFTDADTAGPGDGSPNRFTTIGGDSHLFFLTAGLRRHRRPDDADRRPAAKRPTTPTSSSSSPSAKAAIDKAVEMGVADRDRVGVGGHSYGGVHDRQPAGPLATSSAPASPRSGAYNRTLTPFGFQNEQPHLLGGAGGLRDRCRRSATRTRSTSRSC